MATGPVVGPSLSGIHQSVRCSPRLGCRPPSPFRSAAARDLRRLQAQVHAIRRWLVGPWGTMFGIEVRARRTMDARRAGEVISGTTSTSSSREHRTVLTVHRSALVVVDAELTAAGRLRAMATAIDMLASLPLPLPLRGDRRRWGTGATTPRVRRLPEHLGLLDELEHGGARSRVRVRAALSLAEACRFVLAPSTTSAHVVRTLSPCQAEQPG
jgi:hypothetical protein